MTATEPLESRRLFAATAFDTAFADNGRLTLPAQSYAQSVLATHGAIYVDVANYTTRRREILKFTDAGKPDKAWGDNGVVVPAVFPKAWGKKNYMGQPTTLAYDPRTRGLLVGFADDTVIDVQRFTPDGKTDTAWGDNGRIEYGERLTELTLEALKPLSGKRVLLAFDRSQLRGERLGTDPDRGGSDDTVLARLDRRGRFDKTFNGGRPLAVAVGSYARTYVKDKAGDVKEVNTVYSDPTFQDVQLLNNGGYRVVTTRIDFRGGTTYYEQDIFGDIPVSNSRVVTGVASTVVSADGAVQKKRSQTYVLRRDVNGPDANLPYNAYEPVLASAVGDDAVAVLATRQYKVTLVRVSPGYRSGVTALPFPDDARPDFTTRRNADGRVLVKESSEGLSDDPPSNFVRLNADLTVDTTFGRRGVYRPAVNVNFGNYALDDAGRMVSEDGDQTRVVRRTK